MNPMKTKPVFFAWILPMVLMLFGITFVTAQNPDTTPVKAKPALLVIDIQNAFLTYIPEDDRAFAMKIINHTISTFDQHHLPVIKVHHSDPTWGPVPGTEPFEFPESVIQAENEIHLVKHYHSAFQQTSLDSILQANGCNTLYLCGLSATGCVLATYFGANERDYPAMMIREGIMSPDKEYTKMVNDICESVSFMTMMRMLKH